MLAQATPTVDFLTEFAKLGVLGLVAAAAIWWAIRKDGEANKEKQARIDDAKAAIEIARTSTEALTKWTVAQEERNRTMEQMARAVERLTAVK
jgi:hypothetical protein